MEEDHTIEGVIINKNFFDKGNDSYLDFRSLLIKGREIIFERGGCKDNDYAEKNDTVIIFKVDTKTNIEEKLEETIKTINENKDKSIVIRVEIDSNNEAECYFIKPYDHAYEEANDTFVKNMFLNENEGGRKRKRKNKRTKKFNKKHTKKHTKKSKRRTKKRKNKY